MSSRRPSASGVGVPSGTLDSIAASLGFGLRDAPDIATAVHVFASGIDEAALAKTLRQDARLYLEAGTVEGGASPPAQAAWAGMRDAGSGGFGLVVSTRTAYHADPAQSVAEAVASRAGSPLSRHGMRAALQEALANAILHGNLGLGPWRRSEDILTIGLKAGERLADPCYGQRRIAILATWSEEEIRLSVTDQGAGFDPARTVPGTAEATCGRGLSIIAGSTIAFRHEDGGRTLSMVFKRRPVRSPFHHSQQHLRQALAGCRILVVDDSEANRFLIESMLGHAGLGRIVFAEDGIAGLGAVERFQPDLVLLDLNMPRMGGEEMLRRLRAEPRYQDLPVIIQTAVDDHLTRGSLFQSGATDFVGKPLYIEELVGRVRVHLHNHLLHRRRSYPPASML